MKLSTQEIRILITCLQDAEDSWSWEGNHRITPLKEKLQYKLDEINGKESRPVSNSELRSMGM